MLPTFDIPPIGPKQGKVWGWTAMALAYNSVEVHVLKVKKGGYCSTHEHRSKWNRFVILEGKLAIRIHYDGSVDETILGPLQVTDVPPGVRHEFEALADTICIECYWTALDPNDIERHGTQGGMRSDIPDNPEKPPGCQPSGEVC